MHFGFGARLLHICTLKLNWRQKKTLKQQEQQEQQQQQKVSQKSVSHAGFEVNIYKSKVYFYI